MLYEEKVRELLTYYDGIEKMFNNILENSPPGGIICQMNHGNEQLLQVFNQDGKRIRRGINGNEELQRALARKEFARRSLEIVGPNVNILRRAVEDVIPYNPDEILKAMGKGYSKLPEDYFFNRESLNIGMNLDRNIKARIDKHREWGAQPYQQSRYREEDKDNRTSRGLWVRSKSEALIIETLYHKKQRIPPLLQAAGMNLH